MIIQQSMTISTKKSQVGREIVWRSPALRDIAQKAEQNLGGGSGRIICSDEIAEHDDQRQRKGVKVGCETTWWSLALRELAWEQGLD